ncbi:PAS domain-containing protein [Erythrobacter sp.]|uniref:PAS domain-containing protein n=1 Tax=Erythrobacter sp. TaxID=1042 RepID=UPI001B2912E6|nr:PAS domain-containing protein [Erythrobacter sp.]MBO6528059.1 PAS domain-containing protein [Erythrobacter sp.]MBO6528780.1 PAS domain-containing protein [Erythrobacter sp.]
MHRGDGDGTRDTFEQAQHVAKPFSAETDNFSGASGLLFEQAMAQTRMAVCLTDPRLEDDPIIFCNKAFERLTGYRQEEVVGRNCRFLQGPKTSQKQVAKIREAIRSEEVLVVELLNYRKDGSTFWNALHLGPIYDDKGELRYFFGSQWDVTDIHLARAEERHAKAMAREVSHRLKNVFAVIGGIVNITGRAMDARPVSGKINERIQALGRAYEPTLDEAAFGTIEVGQAIRSVLSPYDPEGGRIVFEGNGARTEPNAVSAIGLTLHELATNASKYGALSNREGTVTVSWHHEEDRHGRQSLVIDWKEKGGPPITAKPEPTGTGFDIADRLLAFSRGTLDRIWEGDGLRARISLALKS